MFNIKIYLDHKQLAKGPGRGQECPVHCQDLRLAQGVQACVAGKNGHFFQLTILDGSKVTGKKK